MTVQQTDGAWPVRRLHNFMANFISKLNKHIYIIPYLSMYIYIYICRSIYVYIISCYVPFIPSQLQYQMRNEADFASTSRRTSALLVRRDAEIHGVSYLAMSQNPDTLGTEQNIAGE